MRFVETMIQGHGGNLDDTRRSSLLCRRVRVQLANTVKVWWYSEIIEVMIIICIGGAIDTVMGWGSGEA
jgi:hypothetical protein